MHRTYVIGLGAPALVLVKGDPVIPIPFAPEGEEYSIVRGILTLCTEGPLWAGLVLVAFTIVLPVAKLAVMSRCAIAALFEGRAWLAGMGLVSRVGKWSMADVFVLALAVIASRSFPLGYRLELLWGAWVYAASVLLAMGAHAGLRKAGPEDAPGGSGAAIG